MKKILFFTLLVIIAPILIFSFLGCMKKPDHTPDYGPEVTFEDIQKAAVSDTPPNPESIKKDQYVSIDINQVIDTQVPVPISQKVDSVTKFDVTSDPKLIQWTFHVEMKELSSSGSWETSIMDHDLVYEKSSMTSTSKSSIVDVNAAKAGVYSLKALQTSDEQAPVKVTYHNLKRDDGFMPVPVEVKKKTDCGGLKNCDAGLRYRRLSFDRVIWDSADHGTKTSYKVIYSPDIPTYIADWSHPEGIYPTNQFQFCAQTWIEMNTGSQNQVVPVQQCADMRDFQFGHD